MTATEIHPATTADEVATLRAELARYQTALRQVTEVCLAAARGDLEPRLLEIPEHGDLAAPMHAINHMLDLTDAFVREASASLQAASDERFYRRVMVRGLHGCFRRGAELINTATTQMQQKTDMLARARTERLRLADNFESAVKVVVENVAAAATESLSVSESLSGTADGAAQQATTLAAASEQASASVNSIATASEWARASSGLPITSHATFGRHARMPFCA